MGTLALGLAVALVILLVFVALVAPSAAEIPLGSAQKGSCAAAPRPPTGEARSTPAAGSLGSAAVVAAAHSVVGPPSARTASALSGVMDRGDLDRCSPI